MVGGAHPTKDETHRAVRREGRLRIWYAVRRECWKGRGRGSPIPRNLPLAVTCPTRTMAAVSLPGAFAMTRLKIVLFAAALPAVLPTVAAQPAPVKAHAE